MLINDLYGKAFPLMFISLRSVPDLGEKSRLGQDSDQTREEVSKQSFSVVFALTLLLEFLS